MSFDYSELRGRIKARYQTQDKFALKLGISSASLSDKLNGKSDFSHNEIIKSCKLLEIPTKAIPLYFFTERVKEA